MNDLYIYIHAYLSWWLSFIHEGINVLGNWLSTTCQYRLCLLFIFPRSHQIKFLSNNERRRQKRSDVLNVMTACDRISFLPWMCVWMGPVGAVRHQHPCVHNQQQFPSAKPHCVRPPTTVPSTPSRSFSGAFKPTYQGSSTRTKVDVTSSLFQQPQQWFYNCPVSLSVVEEKAYGPGTVVVHMQDAADGLRASRTRSFTAGWNPFRWKLHLVSSGSVDSDPRTRSSLPTHSLLYRAPWLFSN